MRQAQEGVRQLTNEKHLRRREGPGGQGFSGSGRTREAARSAARVAAGPLASWSCARSSGRRRRSPVSMLDWVPEWPTGIFTGDCRYSRMPACGHRLAALDRSQTSRITARSRNHDPVTLLPAWSQDRGHFVRLYARSSMVWPTPRTKTSSLFALQEATLGPALNAPPRSSHSLYREPCGDEVGDGVVGSSLAGRGGGVAPPAVAPMIKKRPIPEQ
jgi:hypothetical protein